jgi:hypothetical protein
MALFGAKTGSANANSAARTARHSSGWLQLHKHLQSKESLRLLDIGPTSAGNINFTTNLGHSIYMANLVEDAARPEYLVTQALGPNAGKTTFDVARYLKDNLDFAGRTFNVVCLWDTADYLPEALVAPVIERIYEVMEPGGQLLAFFHSKLTGDDTQFSRYHLTSTDLLEMQRIQGRPILHNYTARQVETLFKRFASHKFYLAKDTIREVIVIR